ncbi:MAG: hypothetical protein ACRCXB_33540 [Aeromonadaceae bacterium]
MDYVSLLAWLYSLIFMTWLAIKSLRGKVSITSDTIMERIYLFAIHATLAGMSIKPLAEVLHKILGGN